MSKLSTKLKIILIVFAVLVGAYAIQYVVTLVANSSRSREHFQNDSDSGRSKKKEKEKFTEEDKSEPKGENQKIVDKQVKLNVLEKVEQTFDQLFPNSDKKPEVFDMLMSKEHFKELKERYQGEEGAEGVANYVRSFIKKTMSALDGEGEKFTEKKVLEEQNYESYSDEEIKEVDRKPLQSIVENLEIEENQSRLRSQLDDVVERIDKLKDELKKLEQDTEKRRNQEKLEEEAKKWKGEKFTQPTQSTSAKKTTEKFAVGGSKGKTKEDIVEGFENRINYAYY